MTSNLEAALHEIEKTALRDNSECYLVGGYLRDRLLGNIVSDIDIALPSDPKGLAKKIARSLGGSLLALEEEREIYRVILKESDKTIQLDFARFKGPDILSDLGMRDFSINAMALKIGDDMSSLLDPYQGRSDIKKRIVRQISPDIYADDPLRILRAFRISLQLGFELDTETCQTITENAGRICSSAAERIREELLMILDCPHSLTAIRKMDEAGLVSALFPDIDPNRTCAMEYYPRKGVWGHIQDSLECLEYILENLKAEFPHDHEKLACLFNDKGSETGGHKRSAVMKLAILLHDVGKAATARMDKGRLRFYGHQDVGAEISSKITRRYKFSGDAIRFVSKLVQSHMRPGGLAHSPVITDKAKFRFFRDLGPAALPMLIISLADRYCYVPVEDKGRDKDIHENLVKKLVRWHYQKELEDLPKRPKLLDGHVLMEKLKLEPGPLIGKILSAVEEAQVLGEIGTKEEALSFSSNWLKARSNQGMK